MFEYTLLLILVELILQRTKYNRC